MGIADKIVTLKLTAATVIDGALQRAGTLLEMVEDEAKELLRRGKAELHAIEDAIEGKTDDAATQAAAAQAAADATKAAPKAAAPAAPAAADTSAPAGAGAAQTPTKAK